MIDALYRFHGHGSLRYVYKNGEIARSRYFIVKTLTNPRRKHSRFAVVISKKTLKSAVGRNRIRRRVYEVLREELPAITLPHDTVIIVVSAEVRDIPSVELHQAIRELFMRVGIYKSRPSSGILSTVTSTDTVEKSEK